MHDAQIRVAIAGAGGRMGRQLIQAVQQMDGAALGAAIAIVGGSYFGGLPDALGPYLLSLCAFLGGLGVTALVYRLGRRNGQTNVAVMLLAGIALVSGLGLEVSTIGDLYVIDSALPTFHMPHLSLELFRDQFADAMSRNGNNLQATIDNWAGEVAKAKAATEKTDQKPAQ